MSSDSRSEETETTQPAQPAQAEATETSWRVDTPSLTGDETQQASGTQQEAPGNERNASWTAERRESQAAMVPQQQPGAPVSPVTSLGPAMRGFVRGMLPPQGLDTFLEELRTTATQVADMYANLFRFQVESVERTISETRLGRSLQDQEEQPVQSRSDTQQ